MDVINACNLTRRFGDFVAVDSVSFTIDQGEIVGLLGHNGAGKTTIMKILTGFLEPSSGSIEIDGERVSSHAQRVQRKIGYLPESVPLYPDMCVVDYLEFVAVVRDVSEIKRQDAICRAMEATDLASRAFDTIGTLSRGYQQRVGVAQAILHEPQFLILDEPTNGLDPSQTQEMRNLIRRLAARATIILSTHVMQEVDAVCDRVMILRSGKLALDQNLVELQQGQRLYIGTRAPGRALQAAIGDRARVVSTDFDRAAYLAFDKPLTHAMSSEIAKLLVANDIDFHALRPDERDLETVFREVSEGELSDD